MSRDPDDFDPRYLVHFYRGIEKALSTQNNTFLAVIIRNWDTIFQKEFAGLNYLIPSIVKAIARLLIKDVRTCGSCSLVLSLSLFFLALSLSLSLAPSYSLSFGALC